MPRRYFIFISFKGQRYSSAGYITLSHSEGGKNVSNTFLVFSCFLVKSNHKSRLREISREVAQKAGEMRRAHSPRREPDRTGQHRVESRYRGGLLYTDCKTAHTQNCQVLLYKSPAFPLPYITLCLGAMC